MQQGNEAIGTDGNIEHIHQELFDKTQECLDLKKKLLIAEQDLIAEQQRNLQLKKDLHEKQKIISFLQKGKQSAISMSIDENEKQSDQLPALQQEQDVSNVELSLREKLQNFTNSPNSPNTNSGSSTIPSSNSKVLERQNKKIESNNINSTPTSAKVTKNKKSKTVFRTFDPSKLVQKKNIET
ncbi:hypothetical protein PACTADRAFT_50722 [Pachysolen tannophilus NRRL Y-2460]|uniref:Uncharacterized protein n=1 Tax=Pachysolen tannophilus NRRL Y-2460 TaxID=669874 RepID=A0A1E4TT62_PACTA|nr:hypothetical protein PACTADRAFT_50722 [Pachysolen tannophilus NRRL Y-2460]